MDARPKKRGSETANGGDVSRSPPDLSHVPCKFYRQGTCQAGKACPFSHSLDPASDQTPCKYFQKGNCKFGAKCMLAHILPDGRRVNARAPYPSQHSQFQRIVPEPNPPSKSALHSSLLQASLRETNYHDDFPSLPTNKSDGDSVRGALDAPLPSSFEFDGLSYFARNGPLAASMPSKFDSRSPSVTSQPGDGRTPRQSLRDNRMNTQERLATDGGLLASPPGNNLRKSGDARAAIQRPSSSFPAHGGMLWTDKQHLKEDSHFAFEEDFVPSSLQELLTPMERLRKAQSQDDNVPSISEPISSQSSSPNQSRFGALFERHRKEEAAIFGGSALRHSYGNSPVAISPPSTSPLSPTSSRPTQSRSGDVSPYLSSPPRQAQPLPLRQSLLRVNSADRSELQASASPWQPLHASKLDRSTNAVAAEEEETFFMEEDVMNRMDTLTTS